MRLITTKMEGNNSLMLNKEAKDRDYIHWNMIQLQGGGGHFAQPPARKILCIVKQNFRARLILKGFT